MSLVKCLVIMAAMGEMRKWVAAVSLGQPGSGIVQII